MLDTIILNIPRGSYSVIKPERFTPPARNLDWQAAFYTKFVNNPTAAEKRSGIYRPRLTINKRGSEAPLKIEFSAPKLLFNNNLQELSKDKFLKVLETLKNRLWDMGVAIRGDVLRTAEVVCFHPSKNIQINGGYSAMGTIKELSKVSLNEKLDLNKTQFRNEGHGLQFYAKSHSLVFYDKMEDLKKTEKRAIDKDQKLQQQSLFDFLERKRSPEILRMEVRLSEKQKMKSVLEAVGYKGKPTFEGIFDDILCQSIVKYYFDTYILPSLFVFNLTNDPQTILKRILKHNPKISSTKAIYQTGLEILCKDNGIKSLRKLIEPKTSLRTWQRIAAEIKQLNKVATVEGSHSFVRDIVESISKFEPYKLI